MFWSQTKHKHTHLRAKHFIVPTTTQEDPLGIESWRADDDSPQKEKPGAVGVVHTPDLGRGHMGEPIQAGPPG